MEDWKKSEGTFNLACDPQRASKSFPENRERLWDCWK